VVVMQVRVFDVKQALAALLLVTEPRTSHISSLRHTN